MISLTILLVAIGNSQKKLVDRYAPNKLPELRAVGVLDLPTLAYFAVRGIKISLFKLCAQSGMWKKKKNRTAETQISPIEMELIRGKMQCYIYAIQRWFGNEVSTSGKSAV